jgi:hypothetical protein
MPLFKRRTTHWTEDAATQDDVRRAAERARAGDVADGCLPRAGKMNRSGLGFIASLRRFVRDVIPLNALSPRICHQR